MKFLLCGASLLPLPYWLILRIAKNAGFDGVEFFLFTGRWPAEKIVRCLELADKLDLVLHFHQTWNQVETTEKSLVQKAMTLLGWLPRRGYTLAEHIPTSLSAGEIPVVVYAERFAEATRHPNLWLQTISLCRQFASGEKEYALSFNGFKKWFVRGGIASPLVFDNQHILEWQCGKIGVQNLSATREALLQDLLPLWSLFRPQVRELHFNDCDPAKGVGARNLFTGNGVMPLQEFADEVRKSEWHGAVTPEVSTFIMMRDPWRNPLKLRRKMAEIWRE